MFFFVLFVCFFVCFFFFCFFFGGGGVTFQARYFGGYRADAGAQPMYQEKVREPPHRGSTPNSHSTTQRLSDIYWET